MPSTRMARPDEPLFDQGLGFDLSTLSRRRVLGFLGASVGAVALAACGDDDGATGDEGAASDDASGACDAIPQETAGPYPGDGSNGPDVLAESGVVRRDITTSFGDATGVAEGVPLEIELVLTDADSGCTSFEGAAVYLWQCDRAGLYSLYSEEIADQNYLRGVQAADSDGIVRFTSVFPGCYAGRWPHMHFEVFTDLDSAGDVANVIATSQTALPETACAAVYENTTGYEQSLQNLSQVTLETDNVFGEDAAAQQLATMTGDTDSGYTARLELAVSPSTTRLEGPTRTLLAGNSRIADSC